MIAKILHTKVCIIGAGPAGAATAIFLGKEKVAHFIIDAAKFPRDKVCGDGLDMKAITMLNHIDKNLVEEQVVNSLKINASWGFRLVNPNGKYTEFVYEPLAGMENKPPYATAKRLDLDHILTNQFNEYTYFFQETRVNKIERLASNQWKVTAADKHTIFEIITDLIVGADGDHSIVLKTIGERKINRNHYSSGIRQYWKGIKGIHCNNLMEVYFPKDYPMSYFWIFPLKDGIANVGYGMLSAVTSKHNYNIKEIFKTLIKEDIVLKNRFKNAEPLETIKGWGLPFASLKRKCYGDGWLLVGDAASMVSPTTGEGIGTGMQTGFIAAKFIKKAITENNFSESVFKNYDREIYKRMNDDINLFKLSMFFSPNMMNWVMNHIIPLPYFKKLFQKKVGKWILSAYNKELEVNLD